MRLRLGGFMVAALAAGALVVGGTILAGGTATGRQAAKPRLAAPVSVWSERDRTGTVRLVGQVPTTVSRGSAAYLHRHAPDASIKLSFGLPLHNRGTLDSLIEQESRTHQYLSRDQLYAAFSPPTEQYDALQRWLAGHGFRITHLAADRMSVSAVAPTSVVERTLHVKINDYVRPGLRFRGVDVAPYGFYANTKAPTVPARLGLQSISGLSDVDRFFTQVQLGGAARQAQAHPAVMPDGCGDDDAVVNPLCVDVRSGGYYPSDLRSLYDLTGHGFDGTGQTIGFTLWTATERQPAMNTFAGTTGDQLITIDPSCTATGNSPTTPSSCSTVQVQPDHLLFILENGNSDGNNNFGSNVETALDIEAAHGVATHVAMKYYASECNSTTPPGSGLTNAGCNGSDVGLEEAIEDAASDPTLHSVSNSWAFGGEAEWGAADPFLLASENSLALASAAGTTFYFSTGDSGTYESGYPSDSPHVVAVGGTSTYSTSNPGTYSTSTTWSGGGSWCSNVIARPSWQKGDGVKANASCPGRVIPDVSAVADPNTGVRFTSSTNANGGTQSGQVGGTSLSAPVMNGLQAVTKNFIDAQTYSGPTPQMGFVAPVLYKMGNSGHYSSYFRDIECGNTANPTSGPDGDAATKGWDAATGWGEPEWLNFSIGYARALGATNLSVPPSLSQHFAWSCANTPSNSTERAFSCPSVSTCYAVGNASGGTPWYGKFLPGGAWGAVNTFLESTDGGASWFPSNSDMFSITCTKASTCIEVGAGGRERRTTNGGSTWRDVATAPGNNKPLTQVTCPTRHKHYHAKWASSHGHKRGSSSICYAVGDRGNAMKSTDGGATWRWLNTTDGNPLYGLSCPSTTVCYATDIYAHVLKTTNGGASWTWQQTPITTPGLAVPGSGGPNPYAGLMSISCSSASTCVATGLYVIASGQAVQDNDPPVITTTDGGATWTLRTSNGGVTASASTTLSAAAAAGATNIKVGSVTNFRVGQSIVVDSAGANPEPVTVASIGTSGAGGTGVNITPALNFAHASGSTVTLNSPNYLHGVSCLPGTTTCTAVGRSGAIVTTTDLVNWAPVSSGTTNVLNDVVCLSASFCMAVGQNGTVDRWDGTAWTATTGNGGSGMLASVSCVSTSVCYATGKQGVTLATTDGGTTWTQQAGGGTTQQMNSISCPTTDTCYAAGNAGTILETQDGGQTWLAQTSGATSNLTGISCPTTTACAAVGAASGGVATVRYTTDGSTWNAGTGTGASSLNGVDCTPSTGCVAVGAAGTVLTSGDAGATWTTQTSGTTAALNALVCPAGACYATGAVSGGSAVMLKSVDGGATWTPQTSNSSQALSGIACVNDSYCFADGAFGTIVKTDDGGTTWTQQGNPMSGPTTALNATNIALLGATCTRARCLIGTGAQGDIVTTPLLTVTVNASGPYGSAPSLSGLAPKDPAIDYTPSHEGRNVTGALTCSTTATESSPVGSYPVSDCSGLADDGFNVVYDYAHSSYRVAKGHWH